MYKNLRRYERLTPGSPDCEERTTSDSITSHDLADWLVVTCSIGLVTFMKRVS